MEVLVSSFNHREICSNIVYAKLQQTHALMFVNNNRTEISQNITVYALPPNTELLELKTRIVASLGRTILRGNTGKRALFWKQKLEKAGTFMALLLHPA